MIAVGVGFSEQANITRCGHSYKKKAGIFLILPSNLSIDNISCPMPSPPYAYEQ
jgi:hypothetical protein